MTQPARRETEITKTFLKMEGRLSLSVHADVLRMAKTHEERELIKWFYARNVFFGKYKTSIAEGLPLVKQCEHEDARFLVSLFAAGPPLRCADAGPVFLA